MKQVQSIWITSYKKKIGLLPHDKDS